MNALSSFWRSLTVAAVCLCLAMPGLRAEASPPVAPTDPLSPAEERATFKLPPGFEIQLVASEPEIQKPMNLAFDNRGRLWVTHSIEYPFAAATDATPRDGLTVLEGFGPDGRATKTTLFADGLNIPIGVLPLPGGTPDGRGQEVIVWSIPNIWKLTDTDGDGKADRREVLYGPFDFADTHGDQNAFRLGPDGWVYACHGFRNASKVKLRGEGDVVVEMSSGNTYRFRPDGSAIEQVSWGQVNPFGMCFDRMGNQFTADCHSKPIMMILRGGYYDSFGKPHDGLGNAPLTTGDGHGSTGIAGMAAYEADQFPAEYRGSMFVGNVMTNIIHRDIPEWRGSSPWVEKPADFVSCDDWWFRPVDLQLGPDGGLYVADFYNCIIGHYEVDLKHPRRDRHRGRIWRIVWKGEDGKAAVGSPADLTGLGNDRLVTLMGNENMTVRRLAFDTLIARAACSTAATVSSGTDEVATLLDAVLTASPAPDAADGGHAGHAGHAADRRALAVWGLARLGQLSGDSLTRAFKDPAPLVRVHLVKALAAMPGWEAARSDLVCARLADVDPFVRRAAAEALAEHAETASIQPLLRAWIAAPSDDLQLIQALRIAVRNQLRKTSPDALADLALAPDEWPKLIEIAAVVPDDATAWFAFDFVRGHDLQPDLMGRCLATVAQHCGDARVDEAARFAREKNSVSIAAEAGVFQSLFDGLTRRGGTLSADNELGRWGASLAPSILDRVGDSSGGAIPAANIVSLALKVAEQLRLATLTSQTLGVLRNAALPDDVRTTAAATAAALDKQRAIAALASLVGSGAEPVPLRQAVARQLGSTDTEEARDALATAIVTAPAALQQPFALALASTKAGADLLLERVAAGKASARLVQDKSVVGRLKASGAADLDQRITELTRTLPSADDAIRQVIVRVAADHAKATPSIDAGRATFMKTCANCHRIADVGGKVGPQLDGVGQRGAERLLEDILDPNRNVDEAFRTTMVTTNDGRVLSGLKLREDGGDLILADSTGKEVRIAAADIDEVAVSHLSPMASNMLDQIGEKNLPDLLAYLMQRPTTP
jgi:putative heme-binding domain-containing protein